MPICLRSVSKRLMNHFTSISGRKRLVLPMNELVCGTGMVELMFCHEMSYQFILFKNRYIQWQQSFCLVGILVRILCVVGIVGMCLCRSLVSASVCFWKEHVC